jgi:hypothetical protein
MYSVLELLKGWEWRLYQGTKTVERGKTYEIQRVSETGLIIGAVLTATDCQASAIVQVQGAELRTETLDYNIEEFAQAGFFSPDPAGWVPRYIRPDPNSTAGYYVFSTTPGLYGAPLAFVPTLVLSVRLNELSTQNAAIISAEMRAIVIIEREKFIQSLRRLVDAKASLIIDPAFLATGPADFLEAK